MVGDRNMSIRPPNAAMLSNEAGKSLRTRNLMDDVPIDVEQIVAVVVALDDMPAPNLVVKR